MRFRKHWILSLSLFAILTVEPTIARETEMPPSFDLPDEQKMKLPHFRSPKIDIAAIKKADELAEQRGAAPRYAAPIKVDLTPKSDGVWIPHEKNNSKSMLWRLKVSSDGAKSLNFGFTNFYLPEGAKLFVFSPDYKHIRGPFTAADNNVHRQLWTPIVFGHEAVIEVLVPNKWVEKLELELTSINHDYRGFGQKRSKKSGSCNVDVACGEREGWESQIQSVAVISTGGSTFCTGFLVNNTAQDKKPLFMTAAHCGITKRNAASLVAYWNYQNSTCRDVDSPENGGNGDGNLSQFTTGSTFKAGHSKSDFTIVEFNNPVDDSYNAFYAGWNATTDDPTRSVAIHHPATDEKRISFDYDAATTTGYNSDSVGDASHIKVHDWDIGTTEPGSSGSPLFDQDQRVVGQLHGGKAACGNDLPDWYGRISTSWQLGLKEVLDPINTGEIFIDGIGFGTDFLISASQVQLEGLGANGVADPGETVRASLSLKNSGKNPVEGMAFQMISEHQDVVISNPYREGIDLEVGQSIDLSFTIAISQKVTCGDEIRINFSYLYADKEGRGRLPLQTGKALFHELASRPSLTIPDHEPNGVSDSIIFRGSGGTVDASRLEIGLDLKHTYTGDLTVKLKSPDGKSTLLHNRSGNSRDNISGVYPRTLVPAGNLMVFEGSPIDGRWSLHLADHAMSDIGKLKSWSLRQFDRFVCEGAN